MHPEQLAARLAEIAARTSNQRELQQRIADELHFAQVSRPDYAGTLDTSALRAALDLLPDEIYIKDRDCRFLLLNKASQRALRNLGDVSAYIGRTDAEFMAADVASANMALEKRIMETGTPVINSVLYDKKHGRWYTETKVPWRAPDGRILGIVGVNSTITDLIQAQNALAESEARFRTIVDQAGDAILVLTVDGIVQMANEGCLQLLRLKKEEVVGWPILPLLQSPESTNFGEIWEQLQSVRYLTRRLMLTRSDATALPVEARIGAFEWHGSPALLIVARDITERELKEEELLRRAFYDPLTGLPNRSLLLERLTQALAKTRRNRGLSAVMLLDLDGFKPINDTHGHAAGDALLVALSKRLSGCLRQQDTIARFGGDEFVVLLTELDASADADVIAARLRAAVSEPVTLANGTQVQCSASVGIAHIDASTTDTPSALLESADFAMYADKTRNKKQRNTNRRIKTV